MYPCDVDPREFGPRWDEDYCTVCHARPDEDCADDCTCGYCRNRWTTFQNCFHTAKRMGIAADWLQAQQQTRAFPDRWIAAATWELAKGA